MTREEEIRQAAKEAYIQHISNGGYGSKYDFVNGYIACANKYNQWHKVEKFPPEDPKHKGWSVKVIVINDGQYEIGFYDYKLKRWCVPGCINPYFTNITHWQTFPELPKEI